MTSGIYSITNTTNGKVYIGSTKNFKDRWGEHVRDLSRGNHCNPHLQRSWNKYGKDVFEFIICEHVKNVEQLIDREQYWLDFHRVYIDVYNMALVVNRPSGFLGYKHTEKAKCRIGEASRNRPGGMLGKHHTAEAKRKIGLGHIGNQYALGYKCSEERRRKMGESQKGNKHSLGYKHTDETRRRMSEAAKARWAKVRRGGG